MERFRDGESYISFLLGAPNSTKSTYIKSTICYKFTKV